MQRLVRELNMAYVFSSRFIKQNPEGKPKPRIHVIVLLIGPAAQLLGMEGFPGEGLFSLEATL